jgi:Spy/CpxP family protein refolding chaperone
MNLKRTLMAGAVALSLTTAGFAAQADKEQRRADRHAAAGMRGHHGFHPGQMFGRAAAALNLTDQQKEFAKQLMADTRRQAEPVSAQLRQVRQELTEAVKTNNTDAIENISQRQASLTAQLTAIHAKAMASFYAQLTPEQRAKADEFQARMKERGGKRHNRG